MTSDSADGKLFIMVIVLIDLNFKVPCLSLDILLAVMYHSAQFVS